MNGVFSTAGEKVGLEKNGCQFWDLFRRLLPRSIRRVKVMGLLHRSYLFRCYSRMAKETSRALGVEKGRDPMWLKKMRWLMFRWLARSLLVLLILFRLRRRAYPCPYLSHEDHCLELPRVVGDLRQLEPCGFSSRMWIRLEFF